MTSERTQAIYWCYDNLPGFNHENFEDFRCAIDQKEAELLGLDGGKA